MKESHPRLFPLEKENFKREKIKSNAGLALE
jgi:hypothetical protein